MNQATCSRILGCVKMHGRPLAVAGIVAASSVAYAQEDQVNSMLYTVNLSLGDFGWVETYQAETGALRSGESSTYTLNLNENREYRIIGVCDEDCFSLRLILYDGNEEQVANRSHNEMTALKVKPKETGTYRLVVGMEECDINPCYYGVGFYND